MDKRKRITITIIAIVILVIVAIVFNEVRYQKEADKFMIKNATVNDITKEEGITNIYLFWSKTCGYCQDELKFLTKLRQEDKTFKVYGFEISNKNTPELAAKFEKELDTQISGTPFTVIGDDYFSGFSIPEERTIRELIKEQKESNYDIYFDKIK